MYEAAAVRTLDGKHLAHIFVILVVEPVEIVYLED